MAKIADGEKLDKCQLMTIIDDLIILDEIATALKSIGYAAAQKT